jgi:hypothetical protein
MVSSYVPNIGGRLEQRAMQIERRQTEWNDLLRARQDLQQPHQGRLYKREPTATAPGSAQLPVASHLQHVARPALRTPRHRAASQRLTGPFRLKDGAWRLPGKLSVRFVEPPAWHKLAVAQRADRVVVLCIHESGFDSGRPKCALSAW